MPFTPIKPDLSRVQPMDNYNPVQPMPNYDFPLNKLLESPKLYEKYDNQSIRDLMIQTSPAHFEKWKSEDWNFFFDDVARLRQEGKFPRFDPLPPEKQMSLGKEIGVSLGGMVGELVTGGPKSKILKKPLGKWGVAPGAIAVEALDQNIARLLGDPNVPQDGIEAIKRMLKIGGREQAYELIGNLPGYAAKRAISPFGAKYAKDVGEIEKLFKPGLKRKLSGLGMTEQVLTPAEKNESAILGLMENVGRYSPLTAGIWRDRKKHVVNEVIEPYVENMFKQIGSEASPIELGQEFLKAYQGKKTFSFNMADRFFSAIRQTADQNNVRVITARLPHLTDIKQALIDDAAIGIKHEFAGTPVLDMLGKIGPSGSMTFGQAQKLRTILRMMREGFTEGHRQSYSGELAGILEREVDASMERALKQQAPGLEKAWRKTNEWYKEMSQELNNSYIRKIITDAENKQYGPEVIGKFVNDAGPTGMKTIRDMLGERSDLWGKTRRYWLQSIWKESVAEKTSSRIMSGEPSGEKLMSNLFRGPNSAKEKGTLDVILRQDQKDAIHMVARALEIKQTERAGGMGRMLVQLLTGGILIDYASNVFGGDRETSAATYAFVFGPAVLTLMMLNPVSARWMAKGIRTKAISPEAGGVAARLVGFAQRVKAGQNLPDEFDEIVSPKGRAPLNPVSPPEKITGPPEDPLLLK